MSFQSVSMSVWMTCLRWNLRDHHMSITMITSVLLAYYQLNGYIYDQLDAKSSHIQEFALNLLVTKWIQWFLMQLKDENRSFEIMVKSLNSDQLVIFYMECCCCLFFHFFSVLCGLKYYSTVGFDFGDKLTKPGLALDFFYTTRLCKLHSK